MGAILLKRKKWTAVSAMGGGGVEKSICARIGKGRRRGGSSKVDYRRGGADTKLGDGGESVETSTRGT